MKRNLLLNLLLAIVISGCGSGGGSSAPSEPVKSTLSFPVRSGLNPRTANGHTTTLTANGTSATEVTDGLCTGTINQTAGPAADGAKFEGAPTLSAVIPNSLMVGDVGIVGTETPCPDSSKALGAGRVLRFVFDPDKALRNITLPPN